jgi:hypothetical protein
MIRSLLVVGLLPLAASASDSAKQWPVQLPHTQAGAYQLTLPADVYETSAWPDLRDVRVLDADGHAVTRAIYAAAVPARNPTHDAPVQWFTLPSNSNGVTSSDLSVFVLRDQDGAVISVRHHENAPDTSSKHAAAWLLDLGKNANEVHALNFHWSAQQAAFDLAYTLEGSHDLQRWQTLDHAIHLIQLNNAQQQLRYHRIPLSPSSHFRYLRMTPLQAQPVLALTDIRGEITAPSVPSDLLWKSVDGITLQNGSYQYNADGYFPVQALDVVLPANTTMRWQVESQQTDYFNTPLDKTWQHWSHAWDTWQLVANEQSQSSAALLLSRSSPHRQWRLTPAAQTPMNPPPILKLGYRPSQLIFLAQGRAPYFLVAGNADAQATQDALRPLLDSLRKQHGEHWQPATASLGGAQTVAGQAAYQPSGKSVDWKTLTLWGVLLLGAASIAGFALSLLRNKTVSNN